MFPTPRKPAPTLTAPLTDGRAWTLSERNPEFMSMVVFYRGLHCPVCKNYLQILQELAGEFDKRGVDFVAISADPQDRAEKAKAEWNIADVPVAYGFDPKAANDWGLLVSQAIKEEETRFFVEPGLFLIKPDNSVFFGSVQSMPFARPPLKEIISAIDFVKNEDYPARGAYDGFQ